MTPESVSRRLALSDGTTDRELRTMYCQHGWSRLRPGAYLPPGDMTAIERHREQIRATMRAVRRESVISHQSAAVWWGIPVWGLPLNRVHITRDTPSGGRRTRVLHTHAARLTEVETVDGIPVTTVARTFSDIACSSPFTQAVAIGDAILHEKYCTRSELAQAAELAAGRHGYRRILPVLDFLDAASESVGESRSRVLLRDLGRVQTQANIFDTQGNLAGRVDFLFRDHRVVGEFDGKIKYEKYRRPGESASDVVFREKVREDRLRGLGFTVVRWTWSDLDHPENLLRRFRLAFGQRVSAPSA